MHNASSAHIVIHFNVNRLHECRLIIFKVINVTKLRSKRYSTIAGTYFSNMFGKHSKLLNANIKVC